MSRPPLGSTLDIFGISIQWYSLLIVAALAIGIALALREEKRLALPKDTIINFALLAIPLCVICARLYYVAFTWSRFAQDPMEIFRVWNGGLAIYGAVIGGFIAALIIAKGRKGYFWSILDACVPALALGQAIGRWGNYANMEAYGARIYEPAAQFFPIAVEIRLVSAAGEEFWYWHMATFFYESMWCLAVFIILMAFRRRMGRRGDVTLWYLMLYCAGRTVIEGLRDDSLMMNVSAAQIRVSQVLSAVVCIGVAVFFLIRLLRVKRPHLADWLCCAMVPLAVACTFIGEFERNAYQMLFIPAQMVLGLMAAVDIAFFIHYFMRARRIKAPAVWALILAGMCIITLLLGIGRLGASNVAYVALRQSVAMAHVVLAGAWLYLRAGPPRVEEIEAEDIPAKEYRHAKPA